MPPKTASEEEANDYWAWWWQQREDDTSKISQTQFASKKGLVFDKDTRGDPKARGEEILSLYSG